MEEELIRLEGVTYGYYGKIPALREVTLGVPEGSRFGIIGANGSGKSTLLQIMAGLVHPDRGEVLYRNRPVTEKSLRGRAFQTFFRTRVGYVFQDSDIQLFCPTVLDELLYGPLQLDIGKDEARERAAAVMKMLAIEHLAGRPSYMLSGGEKKRVAIGSVLTTNPEALLLDEPTNGLDPRTQSFLVELILALSEAGKTIIVATHDLSLVDEIHARVAVLSEEHTLLKTGSSDEILRDDALLLQANLVHEHVHRHGSSLHKHVHSHFLFHRHGNGK